MTSTTIFNALLADLRDVKSSESWSDITLKKVYEEPISRSRAVFPHAALIPFEGGIASLDELTNRSSIAEELFTIQVGIRSTTPHADLLAAKDAVRNAVERSDSAILAISQVELVDVINWEAARTEGTTSNQYGFQEIDVRIQYHYIRGSS